MNFDADGWGILKLLGAVLVLSAIAARGGH